MKKNLYSWMAASTLLLAVTSCSSEDELLQTSGEMTSFSVELEGTMQSRAYGDGQTVDELYYAVYDELGTTLVYPTSGNYATATITGGTATTAEMPLMKGTKYDVVFWAQKKDGAYKVTSLKEISVSYENATCNDEGRDAFFESVEDFTANGGKETVYLKRPFAQLNVGTTLEDWEKAKTILNVEQPIVKSSVTVDGLATKFNAYTGIGTDESENDITFGSANIADGMFTVTKTSGDETTSTAYKYLTMNYLLTAETEKATTDVKVVLAKSEEDKSNVIELDIPSVPVQRNYRTNIIGAFLTGEGSMFEVIVDKNFEEPNYEVDANLYNVLQNGGTITLTEDITITSPLEVTAANATIILDGGSIKGSFVNAAGLINVKDGANLTIKGEGEIVATDTYPVTVHGGVLTVEGGRLEGIYSSQAVYVQTGTAYLKGGEYLVDGNWRDENGTNKGNGNKTYTINCSDTNYKNNTANIIVTGGTFYDFNPADNAAEGANTSYVAEGYSSAKVTTEDATTAVYVVAKGTAVSTENVVSAFANGGEITLVEDINIAKIDLTSVTNDIIINGNGNTIKTTEAYGIETTPGKNVTINNAIVVMTQEGNPQTYAAGFKIANGDYHGKTITLKDCTIKMANNDWAYAVSMPQGVSNLNLVIDSCILEGAIAVNCWGDYNNINITNSELICNYLTNDTYGSSCINLQKDATYVSNDNTVVIDGCTFKYTGTNSYNKEIYAVSDNGDNNQLTITNCTYGENVTPIQAVSSAEGLQSAIQGGLSTVYVSQDIMLSEALEVNGELTIKGVGDKKVTLTAPTNGTRVINAANNTEEVTVNLSDVILDGSNAERGISFYNNTGGLTVNIDNCEIKASNYGLNVASQNANPVLTVKNSSLSGFCAFQTWSANTQATFTECTLTGINNYDGNGNDFATIVINSGADYSKLTFNKCTIAVQDGDGISVEYHLIDNSTNSSVTWNNCTFKKNNETVEEPILVSAEE